MMRLTFVHAIVVIIFLAIIDAFVTNTMISTVLDVAMLAVLLYWLYCFAFMGEEYSHY